MPSKLADIRAALCNCWTEAQEANLLQWMDVSYKNHVRHVVNCMCCLCKDYVNKNATDSSPSHTTYLSSLLHTKTVIYNCKRPQQKNN